MRHTSARSLVGLVALAAGLWFTLRASAGATIPAAGLAVLEHAAAAANDVQMAVVTCPSANLTAANVECTRGALELRCQNRTTTAVYFGPGLTGATRTQGQQHCDGCVDGPRFSVRVPQGSDVGLSRIKCSTDAAADAGTSVQCLCAR